MQEFQTDEERDRLLTLLRTQFRGRYFTVDVQQAIEDLIGTDASSFRILDSQTMGSTDYKPTRLNIYLDDKFNIVLFDWG